MLTVIPLPVDAPLFTQKVTLTGSDYVLRFDYSGRQDCWYCGLYDATRQPIKVGMKVVCGWDVLRTCALSSRPPGQLLFFSTKTSATPGAEQPTPTFADLGRSVLLLYIDATPVVKATV